MGFGRRMTVNIANRAMPHQQDLVIIGMVIFGLATSDTHPISHDDSN